MLRQRDCPLPPALRALLQACLDNKSTNSKVLARALSFSPQTVDTYFKRISELLGVPSRPTALIIALESGWIKLTTPPAEI